MTKVEICEVSPRDGLQNEDVLLATTDKVELVERAIRTGARRIEVASFVHPKRVPQMADAEAVMAALPHPAGVSYAGLIMNQRGLDRALAAGVDEVNIVVVSWSPQRDPPASSQPSRSVPRSAARLRAKCR